MRILCFMSLSVAVAGASGYAGGELLRLILQHPELELGPVGAATSVGQPITAPHPHLPQLADRTFVATTPDLAAGADLLFTALPHGESAGLMALLAASAHASIPVVDLGADFRLSSASSWSGYYGGEHAGTWQYGLAELAGHRDLIRASTRVANPGCYATSVALGLAPLLQAGLVDSNDVVVVAASGTTGAGRSPKSELLASEVMGSLSAYKVGGTHQHTPEMEQSLTAAAGGQVTLSFTPVLAPMPRGILATCTARLTSAGGTEVLREAMHAAYAHEPFVHLLPEGVWPRTADTLGANTAHLQVAADEHVGRAVVVVALDNLVKGAAGQAIQNANLMLGLAETSGLPIAGIAP